MGGAGVDARYKILDLDGWSFWHLHYDIYVGEGDKEHITKKLGYLLIIIEVSQFQSMTANMYKLDLCIFLVIETERLHGVWVSDMSLLVVI